MLSSEHNVQTLCEVLCVSRSGYYALLNRKSIRLEHNKQLLLEIKQIHTRTRATYGSPRITEDLRSRGLSVGHNRVAFLMKEAGLVGRQKRRYKIRTTDSNHDQPIAPNRLSDTPVIKSPDRVWVTDITYIQTNEGWRYAAGVLDRFSRKIVGWAMDSTLHTNLPLNALKMAINRRQPKPGILHHSDRSVQYASKEYRSVLDQYGLVASMSRKGNCYDNAAMESFWSTLKHELIFRKNFATRDEAKAAIFDYIEGLYNKTRLHSALGYKSPLDYELTNNYINN